MTGANEPRRKDGCVFCQIVSGDAPARFEHSLDDEGNLVAHARVVVFHNRLDWARVMLLIVPRSHMTQAELWTTDVLVEAVRAATTLGDSLCPEGYRLISNFGRSAHQSQEHAHIHLVSEPDMDLPAEFDGTERLLARRGAVRVTACEVPGAPLAARVARVGAASQRELWADGSFVECGQVAIRFASEHTPEGFRLISNFHSPATSFAGGGPAALMLLGGGQLDLYA